MHRPIQRLLVANRGEIAVRILSAARELDIETFAVYTEHDASHTYNAAHAIKLPMPSSYMDVSHLVQLVKQHNIDAVHPGYGFLSESVEFSRRIASETNAVVIGPGAEILDRTADKLQARGLAESCRVPTLPALITPTDRVESVRDFASKNGYPIMIKAVDGGGGRGIRLVSHAEELAGLMARAIEESPSRQVFAEKAASEGFRHIEVQIIGDLHGNITHLWERECSIQRRYQKVIEMAPSSIVDRKLVSNIIQSALRMARKSNYVSFGTFEFLANPQTSEYYFLEINPRLQVEHTVTESIALTDLVQLQLRIAQGATIHEAGLHPPASPETNPRLRSLQLRITAEDVARNWSLSVGKIQSFHFPSGLGVRVDTNLVRGIPAIVSSEFDSLLAKVIVTAPTWPDVLRKAKRALEDTRIVGIQTNLHMLQAILAHDDFITGKCDTSWLERNQRSLLSTAQGISQQPSPSKELFASKPDAAAALSSLASSSTIFRKGDAWTLSLEPKTETPSQTSHKQQQHHLEITKVLRNDFPATFSAELTLTAQDSASKPFTMHLNSTTSSAFALSSKHRRGSPSDPAHVIIPFSGKLVEVLVDVGDVVGKNDVICVVKQMKMELEVRASRGGRVSWVTDADDDEDVAEGVLAAVVDVEGEDERAEKKVSAKL